MKDRISAVDAMKHDYFFSLGRRVRELKNGRFICVFLVCIKVDPLFLVGCKTNRTREGTWKLIPARIRDALREARVFVFLFVAWHVHIRHATCYFFLLFFSFLVLSFKLPARSVP